MKAGTTLLVVERLELWPLEVPGVRVVSARSYLTDPDWGAPGRGGRGGGSGSGARRHRVFNLCRSYRYQSLGYYVSLLAEARGHRPLPSVATMEDLKNRSLVRLVAEDLERLIRRSLAPLASDRFTLSIYFGRNLAHRYRRLSLALFNLFPAPLLRAGFVRRRDGSWELASLRPIAAKEVPPEHQDFVVQAAAEHFSRRSEPRRRRAAWRFDLALLVDPKARDAPSDERALQRFVKAAERRELGVERITRDDLGRLAEFDALFLRAPTSVNDYTYRFARRAAAEGLVVIDDPESILRCTNKVYLAELLGRAGVPAPRTVVVHRGNLEEASGELGFPAILKLPDSSFSLGVVRADDRESFRAQALAFLEDSDLVVAQEFVPTAFDWRIGVLDRRPLYACKYHMAGSHWQIVRRDRRGRASYGPVEAVPSEAVPEAVLAAALRAADLVGDGLYGVDVKERQGRVYVIEINDNPNLESGCEDAVEGEALYDRLVDVFVQRLEARTAARGDAGAAPVGRGGSP